MPPRDLHWPSVIIGFVQGAIPALVSAAIGQVYFKKSPPSQPLGQRIAVASYGISLLAIYVGAWLIFLLGLSSSSLLTPFVCLMLGCLALFIATFFIFKGPKWVHWLQIVNAFALVWTYFMGAMAITDDWL